MCKCYTSPFLSLSLYFSLRSAVSTKWALQWKIRIESTQSIVTTMNIMRIGAVSREFLCTLFFIYRIYIYIAKFHLKHKTPSVPSELFVWWLANAYFLWDLVLLCAILCWTVLLECCTKSLPGKTFQWENRQEIIWEPHSNIQVLSVLRHLNCASVLNAHLTRCNEQHGCVTWCISRYDFVCENF